MSRNVIELNRPWARLPDVEKAALLDILQAADFEKSVLDAITRYTEVREQERVRAAKKRVNDLASDHATRRTAGGRYPIELVAWWEQAATATQRSLHAFMRDAANREAAAALKEGARL